MDSLDTDKPDEQITTTPRYLEEYESINDAFADENPE